MSDHPSVDHHRATLLPQRDSKEPKKRMPWPYSLPPPLTQQQVQAIKKALWDLLTNPLGPIVFQANSGGGLDITDGTNVLTTLTSAEKAALLDGIELLGEYQPAPPPEDP